MLPLLLALATPASADLVAPRLPSPPPPPDRLAQLVAASAGDPYALPGLRFTFAVSVDGESKVRRTHTWCPQAGLVQVETDAGTAVVSAVDGSPVGDTTADAAAGAWSAFVNDQYWLLAPSKVLDPGVRRSAGEEDWTLQLAFGGVGLTPGDRYTLKVSPDSHRVTSWSFELQSGRTGSFVWRQWKQVGGLDLSTARVDPASKTVISFPRLDALDACPLATTAPPAAETAP